jgi:hypothetical protein
MTFPLGSMVRVEPRLSTQQFLYQLAMIVLVLHSLIPLSIAMKYWYIIQTFFFLISQNEAREWISKRPTNMNQLHSIILAMI